MTKVTIGISLDLDDIEFLDEIARKYHQKSRAQAVHLVIGQLQQLADERRNATKIKEPVKTKTEKESFAHGLPDKYKPKKPSNPMVDL